MAHVNVSDWAVSHPLFLLWSLPTKERRMLRLSSQSFEMEWLPKIFGSQNLKLTLKFLLKDQNQSKNLLSINREIPGGLEIHSCEPKLEN